MKRFFITLFFIFLLQGMDPPKKRELLGSIAIKVSNGESYVLEVQVGKKKYSERSYSLRDFELENITQVFTIPPYSDYSFFANCRDDYIRIHQKDGHATTCFTPWDVYNLTVSFGELKLSFDENYIIKPHPIPNHLIIQNMSEGTQVRVFLNHGNLEEIGEWRFSKGLMYQEIPLDVDRIIIQLIKDGRVIDCIDRRWKSHLVPFYFFVCKDARIQQRCEIFWER